MIKMIKYNCTVSLNIIRRYFDWRFDRRFNPQSLDDNWI